MRYVRIFILHLQDVIQNRGRTFIYFLMTLLNPLLLLLFWSGTISEQNTSGSYWNMGEMISYYLLLTIAMSFLVVHIEEDVAFHDIKEGVLAKYLLRPFSYLVLKFIEELPWRITQGFFGLFVFVMFLLFWRVSFPIVRSPIEIILTSIMIILALGISYIYKMILGLLALWTTDFWGILSIEEVIFLVFGGVVMPLTFYPTVLERISYILPIAYIVYFPVVAIQGRLPWFEMSKVIMMQAVWLSLLYGAYRVLWSKGVKKFTAVGQ